GAADLPRTVEGAGEGGAAVTTREEFMVRIRAEMGKTRGLFPATPATRPEYPREEAEAIRAQLAERWPEALERFRREFEKVGGVFHRVPTLPAVPQVVLDVAPAGLSTLVVRPHRARRVARAGRRVPRALAIGRCDGGPRRSHQLHHRPEPHGGYRAHAHARRPRAERGARHLRRAGD